MKQEDKELILKDLCARIPYGVKLQNVNNIESIVKLRSIDLDNDCCEILFYTYQGKALTICDKSKLFRFGKILRYKPYLFPLSSMTEEQKRVLLELTGYEARCEESGGFDSWGFYVNIVGEYKYEDGEQSIILYPDDIGIDWLNKNHFDYRGLIEKGLAIDATGLNIY